MALKFVAVLSVCSLLVITCHPSVGIAGGPPIVAPPVCAPPTCPPPSCAPPTCGPGGGPFALLGGLLGACTNVCGAVIGIPSAIMGGLLAPAPKRMAPKPLCGPPVCAAPVCGPPVCGPPVCMPSPCAPPMCAPARITKCKPYASENRNQAPIVRYQAEPYFAPASWAPVSQPYPAYPVSMQMSETPSVVPYILDMPFKLVSGTLHGSGLYNMSFAAFPSNNSKALDNLW